MEKLKRPLIFTNKIHWVPAPAIETLQSMEVLGPVLKSQLKT